jgi:hypothetical protein
MNQPPPDPSPRPRPRRRSVTPIYLVGVLVVCLVALAAIYLFQGTGVPPWQGEGSQQKSATESASQPATSEKKDALGETSEASAPAAKSPFTDELVTPGPGEPGSTSTNDQLGNSGENLLSGTSEEDVAAAQVTGLIEVMNDFYDHLDQQPYMQAFSLPEPSRVYFSKLIAKLLSNPPVVTRETDDLYTLLRNTAHFFRVLGKENMFILKGILDRERESLEILLQTFYALTYHPQALQEEYNLDLDLDSLYDYGAFFLHTMGGRLYLFRRDSTSRMAVSYYAIQVVDRANMSGEDRHGIDLLPSIDALIEEMENGGKLLTFRDEYLDSLYDLQEKYEKRYSSTQ